MPTTMKDENLVMLWNSKKLASPAYQFFGHAEAILEFCWKSLPNDDHYQLVTYSRDLTLRIWNIDARLRDLCEFSHDEDHIEEVEEEEVIDDDFQLEVIEPSVDSGIIVNLEAASSREASSSAASAWTGLPPEAGVIRSPSLQTLPPTSSNNTTSAASFTSEEEDDEEQPTSMAEQPSLADEEFEVSEEYSTNRPRTASSKLTEAIACERIDNGHCSESNIAMTMPRLTGSTAADGKVNGANGGGFTEDGGGGVDIPGLAAPSSASVVELASSAPTYYEPTPLVQEFSLLNLSDNLVLEKSDLHERVLIILGKTTRHRVRMKIEFPDTYPLKKPVIAVEDDQSALRTDRLEEIRRRLTKAADYHFSKNRRCLEMCLRQFEIAIDGLIQEERAEAETEKDYVSPLNVLGGLRNMNIPFPRTCGARFCGVNKLVIFGQKKVGASTVGLKDTD
jgi:hypothetical protein